MGVDYRAVIMVGEVFEDGQDCFDSLVSSGVEFNDEEIEAIDGDGLQELLYDGCDTLPDMVAEDLNAYTGCGLALGFELDIRKPESFGLQVSEAMEKYKALTGREPSIISEVKVY